MISEHPFPDEAFTIKGGCFCKALRYTIAVPHRSERPGEDVDKDILPFSDIDHCDDCRRASGALVSFWFIIASPWIRWTAVQKDAPEKEPLELSVVESQFPNNLTAKTYMTHYATSEDVRRVFCGRCGTYLAFMYVKDGAKMENIDVTTGSIDREYLENDYFKLRPRVQGWWTSGIEWMKLWLLKGQEDDVRCSAQGKAIPSEDLNALLEKGRKGRMN